MDRHTRATINGVYNSSQCLTWGSTFGLPWLTCTRFFLSTPGAELDEATVEGLVREFAASWKSGIEAINQDVLSFFSNFRNGMEILKQVMAYTSTSHRFDVSYRVRHRSTLPYMMYNIYSVSSTALSSSFLDANYRK